MNMNNQTLKPASPHALKVLLLVCAGALLVIALTLASDIQRAQSTFATRAMTQTAQSIAPRGPEADPSMRHAPGGYDYELELPPADAQ